jgi:hypothetical protein
VVGQARDPFGSHKVLPFRCSELQENRCLGGIDEVGQRKHVEVASSPRLERQLLIAAYRCRCDPRTELPTSASHGAWVGHDHDVAVVLHPDVDVGENVAGQQRPCR